MIIDRRKKYQTLLKQVYYISQYNLLTTGNQNLLQQHESRWQTFLKWCGEKNEKWEQEFMSSTLLKVNLLFICEDD